MIDVEGLSKSFPGGWRCAGVNAVCDVTFRCLAGTTIALVGANGAGKTTLLRMLATAIKPTAGRASVAGFDLQRSPLEIRRSIGFLSTNTGLYPRLTPREILTHQGRLYGLSDAGIRQRSEQMIEALRLQDFLDRACDKLSTGMRQRVGLARTLLHDPPLLILDEPTLGLDIEASRLVVEFIESARVSGRTILLSTHIMGEVQRLCSRVLVMASGRLVADSPLDDLLGDHGDLESAVLAVMRSAT